MIDQHIWLEFFKSSMYKYMSKTDQAKGLIQPPLELECLLNTISLPKIDDIHLENIDLKEAIIHRKSNRSYRNEPISLEELSYALYMTQGVKRIIEDRATLRTVPSAGARHPFETYLAINHVDGLTPGLYRYLALSHTLVLIKEDQQIGKSLAEAALNQQMISDAALTFVWVADSYRTTYRYGMRGYRYMFLDAGHVCQNLYLVAEQLGFGTCAIAAYDDEAVNQLLNLDGVHQFAIYMAPFGKIK